MSRGWSFNGFLSDEKLKEGHQLVQFIIFRSKILGLFWESFGFKFEEHTNHLGEVLLVAAKVEPDGNAEVRFRPR